MNRFSVVRSIIAASLIILPILARSADVPDAVTPALTAVTQATPVQISGVVVSRAWQDFFYIQARDRSAGIRVEKTAHGVSDGAEVTVTGTLATDQHAERYIAATSVTRTGSSPAIRPLGMPNRDLGIWSWRWVYFPDEPEGQRWKYIWTDRSASVRGTSTTGLLARTWGRITQIDPAGTYFYINDGTDLNDGTKTGDAENIGIRVACDKLQNPIDPRSFTVGQYVAVTGISAQFQVNSDGYPRALLLARGVQDIVVY